MMLITVVVITIQMTMVMVIIIYMMMLLAVVKMMSHESITLKNSVFQYFIEFFIKFGGMPIIGGEDWRRQSTGELHIRYGHEAGDDLLQLSVF